MGDIHIIFVCGFEYKFSDYNFRLRTLIMFKQYIARGVKLKVGIGLKLKSLLELMVGELVAKPKNKLFNLPPPMPPA